MIACGNPGKPIIKIIMKQMLTSIIVCFVAIAAMAQNKAEIIVSYDFKAPLVSGGERINKMTLIANSTESKYFNDLSLWTDSLESTPEGKAKLDEIIRANCLEFSATLSNIFNQRTYNYTTYNQLNSFESQRRLRGRELLFSISLRK